MKDGNRIPKVATTFSWSRTQQRQTIILTCRAIMNQSEARDYDDYRQMMDHMNNMIEHKFHDG